MRPPILALLTLLTACAVEAPSQEFLAWGDMPYCRARLGAAECARREAVVAQLVRAMNLTGLGTAIFLGDSKASEEACDLFHTVTRPAGYFGAFDGAMVYTPGDNEWTDCEKAAPGGVPPLASLARLREAFFSQPRSLGARPIALERQAGSGTGVENARWQEGQVLFATLHIPGVFAGQTAFAGDGPALAELAAANLAWLDAAFAEAERRRLPVLVLGFQADLWHPCLMQEYGPPPACLRVPYGRPGGTMRRDVPYDYAGFLARLAERSAAFPGHVLLLHGDAHQWLEDPTPGDGRGGVIRNAARFMVPGEEDMRAVRVRVSPGAARVFSFEAVAP